MAKIEHHRWTAPPDEFALRIQVPDAPGFFKKSLVIEPGTRALVIEDGVYIGEVPPGEYTLESFEERLEFWRKKQATVILTRMEDVPLPLTCTGIPTQENLLVDVNLESVVQLHDVGAFLHNLLGAGDSMSIEQLSDRVRPIIHQAVWNVVGRYSITDLTGREVAQLLSDGIRDALTVSLRRYGLSFVEVQMLGIHHKKFDEQRREIGEIWLQRHGVEKEAQLQELYRDTELAQIKRHELQNELQLLAENVKTDRMEDRVGAMGRRIEIRNNLRSAVQSDRMDKVTSAEEMREFLQERDKDRLLSQEEMDELVEGFTERQEDRQQAREHLVTTLSLNRERELATLRATVNHDLEVKTLNHEIELSQLAGEKANVEWRQQLTREREESVRRQESEREELAHQRQVEQIRSELDVAKVTRQNRVALLEQETKLRLEQEQFEAEKRRKAWELEVAEQQTYSQMQRLEKVQDLNLKTAERQQRLQAELAGLKENQAHERELARIDAMRDLNPDTLVAVAGKDNAQILADMKKHEASQQTQNLESEVARARELNDERRQLMEQMNETEKAKADAIAEAYKTAMQSQQQTAQQMIAGLAAANQPAAAGPAVPPVPPATETWYVARDGQRSGPLSVEQLREQIASGAVAQGTMIWKQGMSDWVAAGQVVELTASFAATPPPPPPASPEGPSVS